MARPRPYDGIIAGLIVALARERTVAETFVALLKKRGDAAAIGRGALEYGEAKALRWHHCGADRRARAGTHGGGDIRRPAKKARRRRGHRSGRARVWRGQGLTMASLRG